MRVKQFGRRVGLLCLVIQVLVASRAIAHTDLDDLVVMIGETRSKFRPVTAEDVSSAKSIVRDQLLELTRIVGNGQDWRSYLMWDEQLQEFDSSTVGSAALWQHVHSRVARDTDLFEQVAFQEYRSALRTLIHTIKSYEHPDLETDYLAVLSELAELLPRSDKGLSAADAGRVSELLTKLDRQQQAPELIEAARQLATQPNLIIEVPAKVLASKRHFDEDYTFQQVIRGSLVEGCGNMKVDQSFSLVSSDDSILVKSVVKGTSDSNSLGFGNGVTVRSSGSLQFKSASNISVDIAGIRASGFDTSGTLSTAIVGMSTNYTRRAAKTARQTVYDRQEADRRAAQSQALVDLDATFNARLNALLSPSQDSYQHNVYLPLLRHDRLPTSSSFSSDMDRAQMQIWFADKAQLTAPASPPWSDSPVRHARVAVHESAINNASAMLEGRVRSLVSILSGEVFEYIAESARPSPRTDIRFDDQVAIRVTFRHGALEIRLVGSEYINDGSSYPGMEVTFRYHLENENSKILRLSEPPRVTAGKDGRGLGFRGIAMRRILSNLLKEHVVEAFDLTEMELPAPFDQLGNFHTRQIVIDEGWLIVEADQ